MTGYPVDTHVHLHPGQDLGRCLSAAAAHMAPHWGAHRAGLLLLTEIAGQEAFATLTEAAAGEWQITPSAEAVSCIARRARDGAWIGISAGRQIVTEEGLEVLALGTRQVPPEGAPLAETLASVRRADALAVLPWGFGKWQGARGARIAALIAEGSAPDRFLADSGVRPSLTARPALLAQGEEEGWRCLAGTDPLPLSGEATKAGRFGILAAGVPDPERPFASLAAWLKALPHSPETYGRLERLPRFLLHQMAMQIRKRLG